MTTVYQLYHMYTDDAGDCQIKEIGLFSTRALAKSAMKKMAQKPGFRDYPDGLEISAQKLDAITAWAEGFVKGNPYDPLPGTKGYDDNGYILKQETEKAKSKKRKAKKKAR